MATRGKQLRICADCDAPICGDKAVGDDRIRNDSGQVVGIAVLRKGCAAYAHKDCYPLPGPTTKGD